jgi:hypothetical protein
MELNVHLGPLLVLSCLIQHTIITWLGALSTSLSLVHMSPILSILSQFMSAFTTVHYSHFLRVLRYLCGTISRRLFLSRSSSLQLQAYLDATWASDPSDLRSLSAHCVFFGGSLTTWKMKNQTTVFRSSVEAKLRAMALLTMEVTWLR